MRMSQPGCQSSGWCCEMLRQIFLPTSNRPVGHKNMNSGGLYGYCEGRMILPWNNPPAKGVSSGPRSTKCQSNKLSSVGWASKSSDGSERCHGDCATVRSGTSMRIESRWRGHQSAGNKKCIMSRGEFGMGFFEKTRSA